MKRSVYLLILFLVIAGLFFTGCGGGGGGDSSQTMTPEELEVATAVDSFSAAFAAENSADAARFLDSTFKCYRPGGATEDFNVFVNRMDDFFAAATVMEFRIDNLGVTVESEEYARARGLLALSYTVGAGGPQYLTEEIEMKMERSGGLWGLVEFGRYDAGDPGSSFPPQL